VVDGEMRCQREDEPEYETESDSARGNPGRSPAAQRLKVSPLRAGASTWRPLLLVRGTRAEVGVIGLQA